MVVYRDTYDLILCHGSNDRELISLLGLVSNLNQGRPRLRHPEGVELSIIRDFHLMDPNDCVILDEDQFGSWSYIPQDKKVIVPKGISFDGCLFSSDYYVRSEHLF